MVANPGQCGIGARVLSLTEGHVWKIIDNFMLLDIYLTARRAEPPITLVTGNGLGRTGITERQISYKCTHGNRKHDPAIICHEEQPLYFS